jgi:uncharacterized protein (DUF2141 family)
MRWILALSTLSLIGAAPVPSSPELGKALGRCRPNEPGPALLINVVGLKDRAGNVKLEVYPSNDQDFLQDDNILINAGKVFRRVEQRVPDTGPVALCIRIPGPGTYGVSVLHDRDINRRFGWTVDGIGFSGNPKLGWSKPKAAQARIAAGSQVTRANVMLNYRSGFGVAPLKGRAL